MGKKMENYVTSKIDKNTVFLVIIKDKKVRNFLGFALQNLTNFSNKL